MTAIQIHPLDNVEVLLKPCGDIPAGHKLALRDIKAGEKIVKYGFPVGVATRDIKAGEWVHTHNVKTALDETAEYRYDPAPDADDCDSPRLKTAGNLSEFSGYLRADGRAGVRNEIWIIPTVGCVNSVAAKLAVDCQALVGGAVEGIFAFPHPYGCSQTGADHARTRKLLAALCRHPNAGGVLVLSLGCENLTAAQFREALGPVDGNRVKFLVCQDVADELAEGARLIRELANTMKYDRRVSLPVSKLVVGMKCGGSDGLSGITANPAVGRFSDLLIAAGGSTVLTEVPEMFGAEPMLFNRAVSREVFNRSVRMVLDFKRYFTSHGETVYENPSPGNKAGGITTLEDKSCGCVQKGGCAQVADAVGYADPVVAPGLNLMSGPGNDLVSATALTAAGAQLILFTTGRGTPFGAPAPTVKISSNTPLFEKKRNWIDFNAGTIADGKETLDEVSRRLFAYVLLVASGERTCAERTGARGIAIFKDGVTL
ncbi:MAG: altronate dehydratase [Kiritimatiellae bacterium]|nr:altronate dehydratase [Kiritimatiellia bacterium]